MQFIQDPEKQRPSVSLTILMCACILMIIFILVEAFTNMKSTALLEEFFYTAVGLYFGRRNITFNGKTFSQDPSTQPNDAESK